MHHWVMNVRHINIQACAAIQSFQSTPLPHWGLPSLANKVGRWEVERKHPLQVRICLPSRGSEPAGEVNQQGKWTSRGSEPAGEVNQQGQQGKWTSRGSEPARAAGEVNQLGKWGLGALSSSTLGSSTWMMTVTLKLIFKIHGSLL